jgi:hypothetical protein
MEQRPKEAQDAGFTAAILGKMYWRGEGYEVDEAQALRWFNKGAMLVSFLFSFDSPSFQHNCNTIRSLYTHYNTSA